MICNYRIIFYIVFSLSFSLARIEAQEIQFAYIPTFWGYDTTHKSTNYFYIIDQKNKIFKVSIPNRTDIVYSHLYLSPDRCKVLVITSDNPWKGYPKGLIRPWLRQRLWVYDSLHNNWQLLWETPDDFEACWLWDNEHILVDSQLKNKEPYPSQITEFYKKNKDSGDTYSKFNKLIHDKLFILNLKGKVVAMYDFGEPIAGWHFLDRQNNGIIYCYTFSRDSLRIDKEDWYYESPLGPVGKWEYTYLPSSLKKLDWRNQSSTTLCIFSTGWKDFIDVGRFIRGTTMWRYWKDDPSSKEFLKKMGFNLKKIFSLDTAFCKSKSYFGFRYTSAGTDDNTGMSPLSSDDRYFLLQADIPNPYDYLIYDTQDNSNHLIYTKGEGNEVRHAGFSNLSTTSYFYYFSEKWLLKDYYEEYLDKEESARISHSTYYGVYVHFYRVNLNNYTQENIGNYIFLE